MGGFGVGGLEEGRIVIFAASLVLQCLGGSRYPDAGKKTAQKVSSLHPLFCAPDARKQESQNPPPPKKSCIRIFRRTQIRIIR